MTRKTTPRRLVTTMRTAASARQAYVNKINAFEVISRFSDEGNAERRREWDAAALAEYEFALEEIEDRLTMGASTIREASTRHRPQMDPNDTAALTRTAQAWQFTVLPRLEKGESIDQLAQTVGAEGLLAIERFAPDYLSGVRGSGVGAKHVDASDDVRQVVNRQFIERAETEDGKRVLTEYAHLESDLAAFDGVIQCLSTGDSMGAAIQIGMLQPAATPAGEAPEGETAA